MTLDALSKRIERALKAVPVVVEKESPYSTHTWNNTAEAFDGVERSQFEQFRSQVESKIDAASLHPLEKLTDAELAELERWVKRAIELYGGNV